MMKKLFTAVTMGLGAAFLLFGIATHANAEDIDIEKLKEDIAACTGNSGEKAIAGCTGAIDSGAWTAPNGNLGQLYYSRGLLNFDRSYYQAAIDDFSAAINNIPDMADAYFDRGRSYHELGNAISAKADYDMAHQLDPDNKTYEKAANSY